MGGGAGVVGGVMGEWEVGLAAFSLGCFWGVLHPSNVQIYPPISVSEAAARPKCHSMQS